MKKLLSLSLVLILSLFLTACNGDGGGTPPPPPPPPPTPAGEAQPPAPPVEVAPPAEVGLTGTLTVSHYFTEEEGQPGGSIDAQAYWAQFTRWTIDNPDVTINHNLLPHDDYELAILAAAAANNLPDVFLMKGSWTENWVTNGLVRRITQDVRALPDYGLFTDGVFDLGMFNGEIYGIPTQFAQPTSVVFYNVALWQEAGFDGLPGTWEEIFEAAEFFTDQGITPFTLGNQDLWPFNSCWFSTLGSRFTGDDWFWSIAFRDGNASFTDPNFIDALSFARTLATSGALNADFNSATNQQAYDLFAQGLAAATISGAWTVSYMIENADPEIYPYIRLGIMPHPPGATMGPRNGVSSTAGWFASINSNLTGDQLALAEAFVFDIFGTRGFSGAAEGIGGNGPMNLGNVNLAGQSVLRSRFQDFLLTKTGVPVYDTVLSGALIDVMNIGFQEIMAGIAEPEAVAASLQAIQEGLMN